MTDIENLTGPELIEAGQQHLRNAHRQWEDAPQRSKYGNDEGDGEAWAADFTACTQSIQACAAIAAAAFAGAHAAAFGQLAADAAYDEGDTKLATSWAKAVGARVKDGA
jgi:hypothetical protein